MLSIGQCHPQLHKLIKRKFLTTLTYDLTDWSPQIRLTKFRPTTVMNPYTKSCISDESLQNKINTYHYHAHQPWNDNMTIHVLAHCCHHNYSPHGHLPLTHMFTGKNLCTQDMVHVNPIVITCLYFKIYNFLLVWWWHYKDREQISKTRNMLFRTPHVIVPPV